MKVFCRALASVCFAILLCAPVFAQTALTSQIAGRAQDAGGAVIPGVTVTISSPSQIGGAKETITDEQGVYRFELLSPGTYRVSFALPGFKTLNIDDVTVVAGNTMTINGPMEVSATSEEVTVTSQAPMIDLQQATVGFNWSTAMIEDLPWSKSLYGISDMVPGARVSGFDIGNSDFGTSSTIGASVGGNNVVIIDGLIWCQTYEDYGSFEEMNISTSMKGADQIGSGITINMAVKSGGNKFTGSFNGAYDNGSMSRNNNTVALLAEGLVPGSTAVTHFKDISYDFGGPILKDKLWFYTAYRDGQQGSHIPGYSAYVGGPLALFGTSLRDPTAKLSYQINSKMKFDATWGLGDKWQPNRNASALTPADATEDQNSWSTQGPVGKFTYIIDSKSTATFSVSRGGYWWPAYAYPYPAASTLQLAYCGAVGVTPTAACPVTGNPTQALPTAPGETATDYAGGVANGLVGAHVSNSTSGVGATDGSYAANYGRPIKWQIDAAFSRIFNIGGKANEFKAGYFYWWDKTTTINFGYPNDEQYSYKSLSTETCPNTIICSNYFLHPYQATILDFPNISQSNAWMNGFFLNDKITLSRKLTVNIGWRYENSANDEPAQGNNGSMWFPTANSIPTITSVTNPSCAVNNIVNCGTTATFPFYTLWQPRLAFTYDVFGNGKIALKGGYGRYNNISSSPGGELPGQGAFNPVSARSCTYSNWNGRFPFIPTLGPSGVIGGADQPNLASACSGGVSGAITQYVPNLNSSFIDQYLAGLDIGLSKNYTVRFNITRNFSLPGAESVAALLPYATYTAESCANDPGPGGVLSIANGGPATRTFTYNAGLPTAYSVTVPNTVPSSANNPFGQVCTYTVPTSNTNFALKDTLYQNYNRSVGEDESAATYTNVTFSKAYANKWSFTADLAFQHTRSTAAIPLTPDATLYNSRGMFATLNTSFKMNWVYGLPNLPLGFGHRSLGGFMYSSSFISQSGGYYGYSAQVTNVRGSAVSQTENGQLRRSPWIEDWDNRISKTFKIGDRMTFEAKWDIYNTINSSDIMGYASSSTASSSYLQPNGNLLRPSSITPPQIYEWSGTFRFK